MNKRFVWNFEMNGDNPLKIPAADNFVQTPNKWEARFFWPDDQIITLNGLNDDFLKLSNYQIKHRADTYYLLPNTDYNLKIRHNQLFYKPLLMKKTYAMAYGKKIKLEEEASCLDLPGIDAQDVAALLSHIKKNAIKINVEKEALVFQLASTPTTKFEFAWLTVAKKNYFSVCIESRLLSVVESIAHQLLGELPTSDYITFLKEIT